MWKTTLCFNILLLILLWLLSLTAINPAYNHLVQYAESRVVIPVVTHLAVQVRPFFWIVPLIWTILTFLFGKWISKKPEDKRNAYLTTHLSITLCLGFAMLIFFAIAGILPILKIGAALN